MRNQKIKTKKRITGIITCLFLIGFTYGAESVSSLRNNYGNNKTTWNATTGTLTFTANGSINFNKPQSKGFIWDVPSNVKEIVIKANTTVNGAFHFTSSCTVRGENRYTSVVYGTNQRSWSSNKPLKAFEYSSFASTAGTLYIQDLTCLNPRAFHIRTLGAVTHVSNSEFIDTRGGGGNHSDGIAAKAGSTVDNCYFETGDDVIKVYHNITVSNCTIKMVQNAVPIQLGWGNTGNDVGTFINLTITGNDGRGNDDNAIIVGRLGKYTKTINIIGCNIQNPNASWASLRENGQVLNGEVTDAYIDIQKYWAFNKGKSNMVICGTTQKKNFYDCRSSDQFNDITDLTANAQNCSTVVLNWTDNNTAESGFRVRRKISGGSFVTLTDISANSESYTDNTASENTTYVYQVRPLDGGTAVAGSNQPSVTTPNCDPVKDINDIIDLTASASNCSTVVLNWTDNSTGEGGFRIRRKLPSDAVYTNLTDVPANSETYTDNTAAENTTYIYMVRPLDGVTAVATSNTPQVSTPTCTTACTTPGNTTISVSDASSCSQSNGSITFSFIDEAGRTNISFSIDGGANYTKVGDNTGSYTFSGLAAGTYPCMVQWGNGDCPTDLGDIVVDCQTSSVTITFGTVKTDCNASGKARNVIPFTVTGSTATPSINKGDLLSNGGAGEYKIRHIGMAFGSTQNYTVTVEGVSESITVQTVSSCPKSATGLTAAFEAEIYPNPSNGMLNIALNSIETAEVKILNLAGMVLHSEIIEGGLNTIDATELNKGIYIIQLSTNNNTIQQRVVIH